MIARSWIVGLALLLIWAAPLPMSDAIAKSPHVASDYWIVQLEAPPVVRFEGSGHALMSGESDSGPRLAATAPAVTGAARLDAARPEVQAYAGWLDSRRQMVLDRAASVLGREIEPIHVYRYLHNGFAVELSAKEAQQLAELPGVAGIHPDEVHYLELERGPQMIGADQIWWGQAGGGDQRRGENIVIGVIDSGINWDHGMFSDQISDTGGYVHSNPLGQRLGLCSRFDVHCNEKLIGVYDFTSEGTHGKDVSGHGSHVAAIAAGNRRSVGLDFGGGASNYALSGVAPRAHIVSYKVCRSDHDEDEGESECLMSAIVQALEQAVEDGVHIVNYSIGSNARDPWGSIGVNHTTDVSELFLNLRAAGIMPVSSAGNSGADGAGSISYPANAPWVLTVGNSTHARMLANRAEVAGESGLIALEGTGPSLEQDLDAPVVAADSVDSDNMLACSSFPANSFDGRIAVIMRGTCTFEEKVNHAHQAGAVGVLMINHLPGPPIVMGGLESTAIPSFMLGNSDGVRALAAMANASVPAATIEAGLARLVNEELADQISSSSSRGPAPFAADLMKPNLVAPGTSIISAGGEDADSYAMSTGTSMSSPHIAGATALLLSTRPGWTLDMVQSALETTAETDPVRVGDLAANMNDRGAGRARVDRAMAAGLYLPVSIDSFVSANPGTGGNPGQLNLAGIYSSECSENCSFTRTVRAIEAGTWSVSSAGDLDIEVVPDSFSLAAGEEQELSITVSGYSATGDVILDGAIVLTPDNTSLATQRLPVGMAVELANLPDRLNVNASANRGRTDFSVEIQAGVDELVYRSSSLVRPVTETFDLAQDASPGNPFSGGGGTRTFLVDVPEDALLFWVETVASTAPDIDLYIGYDEAGNGQADPDELVCESITVDELEECLIEQPAAGTWWILVQNYQASSPQGQDEVQLEYALLTESSDYSLAPTGPARHAGGLLDIVLAWDQPAMRRGERWLGALGLATSDSELADVGVVPVRIRRNVAHEPQPTAIFAGETRPAVIGAAGSNDLLYFDVSPGASQVVVTVQGSSSVSVELRHMPFSEVADYAPGTPPAAGTLMATGSGAGTGSTMTAAAEAGRWYVKLENSSSQEALVDVGLQVDEDAPVSSGRGLWSPRDRAISQGIEWQQSGSGFLTWYSYDDDGLPVFFQAIAELDPSASTWSAPLDRVTNPTGTQLYDRIGEVSLTMLDEDTMIFAWRRDGFHGSDIMTPDAARTCPEVNGQETSYSGHWFSPGNSVGGTTVIVTDSVQAHIRYYFDDLGVGRWLFAGNADGPLGEVMELLDYRGFCPDCEEVAVEIHPVGVYERQFDSDSSGTEMLDFVSAAPLHHAIEFEVPIIKLSEALECQ